MLVLLVMSVIDSTVPALLIIDAGNDLNAAGCLLMASNSALLPGVNALLLLVARGDGLRLGGVGCFLGELSASTDAASMFFTMR